MCISIVVSLTKTLKSPIVSYRTIGMFLTTMFLIGTVSDKTVS